MQFTAIDFETANSSRGSVCAVGLVVVDAGVVVRRSKQLIRPVPMVFDPFNVSIHGIAERDVADAPTFGDYWSLLWRSVAGPLVAHNASFDMSVLRHALDDVGIPYPDTDYFCTRVISRLVWPQHPTYALNYVAHTMGIVFQHHDAEEDAWACAMVALAASKQVNALTLYDLSEVCGLRVGHLSGADYSSCGSVGSHRSSLGHGNKLRAADIVPSVKSFDQRNACFGKVFVFTGTLLSMQRKDAMQAVVDRGGICHDTVRNDTDYLVLGQDGFRGYQAGHKSSKMRSAEEMRSKSLPIEIIPETDFLEML